jgi:uncharacterized protein YyaL (SSP411 family)
VEVVLAGRPGASDFESLRETVFESTRLNRVLAHAGSGRELPELAALISSRRSEDGRARAWVCRDFSCLQPTSDPSELRKALDA